LALDSYTNFQTSVANWLHRPDLTAQIVDFIDIGERWLARDLRISQLISQGTVTIAPSGNSVAMPTGWMGVVGVKITTSGTELKYVPPDTLARAQTNANAQTAPWVYTTQGGSIFVAPTWTAGGNLTVDYFKKETALSGSNASNQYLTLAADALLYATLLQAAPYLNAPDKAEMWKQFYTNAIQQLNQQYGVLDANARMMAMSQGGTKVLSQSM
jgi:hypothetical protein